MGGGFPGVNTYTNLYPETGYAYTVLSNQDWGSENISNYLDSLMNRLIE